MPGLRQSRFFVVVVVVSSIFTPFAYALLSPVQPGALVPLRLLLPAVRTGTRAASQRARSKTPEQVPPRGIEEKVTAAAPSECEAAAPQRVVTVQVERDDGKCSVAIAPK